MWVRGERRFYFVAALCRQCNHRHGDEEICYCMYIGQRKEPVGWMPLRDTWLFKVGSEDGGHWDPFRDWCGESEAHGWRERCSRYCVG